MTLLGRRAEWSAKLRRESKAAFLAPNGVGIPAAVSAFPDDPYQAPRSWVQRAFSKLIHSNKLDKGPTPRRWSSRGCSPRR